MPLWAQGPDAVPTVQPTEQEPAQDEPKKDEAAIHMGADGGGRGCDVVAPAADEPRTNKYSEIGFDLMRAQILSQALVHGMKYSFQRNRPTGECCAFPSGHAATAFAAA